MNFKVLTNTELSKLTPDQLRQYMSSYRSSSTSKSIETWNKMSLDEKTKYIFSGYQFYINRRGIEDFNLEEQIDFSLKNEPSEKTKYVTPLVTHYHSILRNENYTFFFETFSPFSQWHKSQFKATTCLIEGLGQGEEYEVKRKYILGEDFPYDLQIYTSAEQFMMYHKAMIFLDKEVAKQIMLTDDVRKIKDLGRQVKNYDEVVWKYFRSKVVYEGNKAKFTQNEDLRKALLTTKSTTLVEASPNDSIWGIGLSKEDSRANKRNNWLGKNLLGEILTIIRVEMMGEY